MPFVDFDQVKQLVPCDRFLIDLGWSYTRREPASVRGPCPIHGSTSRNSRSFSVSSRGFQCFACGAKGDVIRLAMLLWQCESYEAVHRICRAFGITVPLHCSGDTGTVKRNGD